MHCGLFSIYPVHSRACVKELCKLYEFKSFRLQFVIYGPLRKIDPHQLVEDELHVGSNLTRYSQSCKDHVGYNECMRTCPLQGAIPTSLRARAGPMWWALDPCKGQSHRWESFLKNRENEALGVLTSLFIPVSYHGVLLLRPTTGASWQGSQPGTHRQSKAG